MGFYDLVNLVFDWMVFDGYVLDFSVFGFLVDFFVEVGRLDMVRRLFDRLECEVMEISFFVYNKILNILVR